MNTIFTPGMRVLCRDAEWLVTRIGTANQAGQQIVYCVGVDELTQGHQAAFLSMVDSIVPVDPKKTALVRDTSGSYDTAKLFLEAQLRQMPLTDPEPHVEGIGAFDPMDYQKVAVQQAISQLRPRLLLADAVGLGKTIEVGMILSELMKRGQARRILVLTKKSMLAQFQAELWNRFALPLVRLDSVGLAKLQLKIPASKNPFEVYQRIIMSIDTLKDIGRYSHFLENTRWDVVVIDEAHNVSGGTNPEKHLSYRLARRLARRSNSLLLTTATPHNGKRETFGRLINLLDPSVIPDPKLQDYDASDIKSFFLMRFKEDVKDQVGANFAVRQVVPLEETTIEAHPSEQAVYRHLASIRQEILDQVFKARAIVQWGLYKSFLSSPEACRSTAQKRLKDLQKGNQDQQDEAERLQTLVELLAPLQIEQSSRYQLLLRELKSLGWNGKSKSPRILLFTESRVTQDALVLALAQSFGLKYSEKPEDQASQTLAMIHGAMPDTVLASTVEAFGIGSSPVRLLVATDVASEGVNLHHQCHNLIHYDLPWSIITLIQRNGRIDRYGQENSPVIRYLMVDSLQEGFAGDGQIFGKLTDKVEEINTSTRTGESVLKLYDAKKEEEHIAQGLVQGNQNILDQRDHSTQESEAMEATLQDASRQSEQDILAMLMGNEPAPSTSSEETLTDNSRFRLMNDATFLERGYKTLTEALPHEKFPPLQKTEAMFILNPPNDLKRRLGAPSASGSMIFGATAIPDEAWPDDEQLYLTTDSKRVDRAIRAARKQKGQWSKELLMTEQHPALQWLSERLMMLIPRGEAPLIASPHLGDGELRFFFIGQVSSKAGTPLIVDPHAISFQRGGQVKILPLNQAMADIKFEELANTGKQIGLDRELKGGLMEGAVEESRRQMKRLQVQRQALIKPRLEEEEQRLNHWFNRWNNKIEETLVDLSPEGKRAKSLRRQQDEMKKYLKDRKEDWKETHLETAGEPITRLILAVEGVK